MSPNNQREDTSQKTISLEDIPPEDLIAAYNALFEFQPLSVETDDYSLAQPHAFRFVPSVLSNNTATK